MTYISITLIGEGKKKKKKKKSKKKKVEQTEPPTIGLSKLFPDSKFPEGELQEYKNECAHSSLSAREQQTALLTIDCPHAQQCVSHDVRREAIRRADGDGGP